MSRNQIIAVSTCIVICLGIYLFADTKKPKGKDDKTPPMADQNGHDAPQQQQVEVLNFDDYIGGVNSAIKDAALRQKVEQQLKSKSYKELIGSYQKLDKPLAVAYYSVKLADQQPSMPNYMEAGDYNTMLIQTAPDAKARNFLAENALTCYQRASALDSTNVDVKLRLASAYIEGGQQPMQGVIILLDVVKKDSNNIDAQLLLGRFGIVSGQYDKAIVRLEKVLYLQPQNSEAMLLLAEAYSNTGQKEKAIKVLENCKKTVTSPQGKKQIDDYINSIKKPG